ncbi:MAG: 50S ribosomal protein L11 methyltransferase [Woeseiaceae bacterium]
MGWQQLKMPLAGLDQETCEQAMLDAGAVAITYTDAADQPILEPAPGEAPLWRDAIITALFDDKISFDQIALQMLSKLGREHLPDFDIDLLAEREWERAWLDDFKAMQFGERLWVSPHEQPIDQPGAVVLKLDPGLAFGTGTHATTALCLARLDGLDLKGAEVLDFGCGSGILGIAAVLLGAKAIHAIDIDPQAITATRANALANDVGHHIKTDLPDALASRKPGSFDIVLANILAQPLIDLSDALTNVLKPGGRILLSGILQAQADRVKSAYESRIEFGPVSVQDGWVLLDGIHR